MGKRAKEYLENIKIEAVAAEGKSLAHIEGKVLFIPYTVPGDIVDVQVKIKRKGYMEGCMTRLITPSPLRIEPFCSHFGLCGGCKWQILPYSVQLESKERQVVDQLTRIGGLKLPKISPVIGSEKTKEYRNKLEFTFSSNRWIDSVNESDNLPEIDRNGLGFHIPGRFDKVLDIEYCYLQPSPSNEIRDFVRRFARDNGYTFFNLKEQTGFLRNLILRTTSTGEVMVIVVFAYEDKRQRERVLSAIKDNFPTINSLNWIINGKKNDSIADLNSSLFYGKEYIYERMENLTFRIAPKSFYQTNSDQAYVLYSKVREFAGLSGKEVLYDLYTGTGTIALFLASEASKVIGIEYVEESINDAKANAAYNSIQNCSFYAGDMKEVLTPEFVQENGSPDVIVLDPPRAGIHPDVAKVISDAAPSKIVYVSCNPATQARDISLLIDKYEIIKVQPIDMFPHTHHLENIVLMIKKTNFE